MNELETITQNIAEMDLRIANKKAELDELTTKRTELVKSVRSKIKAELQEKAEKYGFVIRNKTTKSKKKVVDSE